MMDPRQSDIFAKVMTDVFHARMIKPSNTWFVLWPGPAIRVECPVDSIEVVLRDIAAMNPIKLKIIHDPMYSGSPLVRKWPWAREEFFSSRVLFEGKSVDNLWWGLDKKHRNSIRQAMSKGVTVRVESEDFSAFFDLYTKLGKMKNFTTMKEEKIKPLWEYKGAKTYIATAKGHTAAVAYVEYSSDVARFGWGAGDPDYYLYRPSNLLHWTIMTDAYDLGLKLYDLGGGTSLFKKGFGARTYPHQILSWDKSLNGELKYEEYL